MASCDREKNNKKYQIKLKRSVTKDLKDIDKQFIPRIFAVIESLADNPFQLQSRKLQGTDTSYRIRIGDYRLIYQVDIKKKLVVIEHIRHRKDVYRKIG